MIHSARKPWILAGAGIAALTGILVPYQIQQAREHQWLETAVALHCRDLPPYPEATVAYWTALGLCAIAVACFVRFTVLTGRRDRGGLPAILGGLLTAVAAVGLLCFVLLTTYPVDPYDPVTGIHDLPCGSG